MDLRMRRGGTKKNRGGGERIKGGKGGEQGCGKSEVVVVVVVVGRFWVDIVEEGGGEQALQSAAGDHFGGAHTGQAPVGAWGASHQPPLGIWANHVTHM
jgi:hypothetical protein